MTAPYTCQRKIIHVGNDVFKSTQDKHHNRDKYPNGTNGGTCLIFENIYGNKHQHAAEHSQQENTQKIIIQLCCRDSLYLFRRYGT